MIANDESDADVFVAVSRYLAASTGETLFDDTPLHVAAQRSSTADGESLKLLLDAEDAAVAIEAPTAVGAFTALSLCHDSVPGATLLLDRGADPMAIVDVGDNGGVPAVTHLLGHPGTTVSMAQAVHPRCVLLEELSAGSATIAHRLCRVGGSADALGEVLARLSPYRPTLAAELLPVAHPRRRGPRGSSGCC